MAPYELSSEVHQAQLSELEQQLNVARNALALERRKATIFKRALEDITNSQSVHVARIWAKTALEKAS
jgi:hypothetical protein